MTECEKVICKMYLEDMRDNCNENRLLLQMLEAEPCEDAISRQATVERLCKVAEFMNEKRDGLGSPYVMAALFIQDNKEEFPSVTPKQSGWIPVSELPKENGWYQCTVIVNGLPRTMELFYKNDKWLDNRRIDMFNTYDIYGYGYIEEKHKLSYQELISEFDWTKYVIAWMPLPEPYKTESEEQA